MGKVNETPDKPKRRRRMEKNNAASVSPVYQMTYTPVTKRQVTMSTSTPIGKKGDDAILNDLLEREFDFYSCHDAGVDVAWDCNSPDAIKTILRSQMQKGLLSDISMRLNMDEVDDDKKGCPKTPQSIRKSKRLMKKRRAKQIDECDLESFKQILQSVARDMLMSPVCTPIHGKVLDNGKEQVASEQDASRPACRPSPGGTVQSVDIAKFNSDSDDLFVDKERALNEVTTPETLNPESISIKSENVWSDEDLFPDDSFLIKATQIIDAEPRQMKASSGNKTDGKFTTIKENASKIFSDKSCVNDIVENVNRDTKNSTDLFSKLTVNCSGNPSDITGCANDKITSKDDILMTKNFNESVVPSNCVPPSKLFSRHSSFSAAPNCMRSLSAEYKVTEPNALSASFKRHKSDLSWEKLAKLNPGVNSPQNNSKQSNFNQNSLQQSDYKSNVAKFDNSIKNNLPQATSIKGTNSVVIAKSTHSKTDVKHDIKTKPTISSNTKYKERDKSGASKPNNSFNDLDTSFNTSASDDILRQFAESDVFLDTQAQLDTNKSTGNDQNLRHSSCTRFNSKHMPIVSTKLQTVVSTSNSKQSTSIKSTSTVCPSYRTGDTKALYKRPQSFNASSTTLDSKVNNTRRGCNYDKRQHNLNRAVSAVATSEMCNLLKCDASLKKRNTSNFASVHTKDDQITSRPSYNFRRTVSNHSIYIPHSDPSSAGCHESLTSTQRRQQCSAAEIERKKRVARKRLEQRKHVGPSQEAQR